MVKKGPFQFESVKLAFRVQFQFYLCLNLATALEKPKTNCVDNILKIFYFNPSENNSLLSWGGMHNELVS